MRLAYESALELAATSIEGIETNNLHGRGFLMTQTIAPVALAERIGDDWALLTEFERDRLHELERGGIPLNLLRYLANASTSNRDEVA